MGGAKARMMSEARDMMKEMEEHGFKPSVITYTSLIEAYCMEKDFQTAGRTQEALDIFDKVRNDGCAPDASFYNSLIYILGRAGRLEDANSVVGKMRMTGVPPTVATFNTLISAACDHSQAENALKMLVKMDEQSCKPDIKTYTPLLKLCCKRQWIKVLRFLICHMFRKDITPDFSTYTLLVTWLCRNGKPAQSCLFLEEMVLKGFAPKKETFDLVAEKLDKANLHSAKKKIQLLTLQAAAVKHNGSPCLGKDSAAGRHYDELSNVFGHDEP
ncbi:hypothetical protein ZWY2020_016994 [Hordeum vulgare]|nr:hypothetical protein ZWY2020_016994 [Hordeum vulgare]